MGLFGRTTRKEAVEFISQRVEQVAFYIVDATKEGASPGEKVIEIEVVKLRNDWTGDLPTVMVLSTHRLLWVTETGEMSFTTLPVKQCDLDQIDPDDLDEVHPTAPYAATVEVSHGPWNNLTEDEFGFLPGSNLLPALRAALAMMADED